MANTGEPPEKSTGASSRTRSKTAIVETTKEESSKQLKTPKLQLTRPITLNFIKKHALTDWFLRVAYAWSSKLGENAQAIAFVKIYMFLREYTPDGLVGKWANIRGNDVMDILLSHAELQRPSRHRATAQSKSNFRKLEQWMGQEKNWQDAWSQAKAKAGKQKNAGNAPGLHSPTHMFALLVMAHPDTKYGDHIDRLQIGWMLYPRETLDIKEGFWKGLNSDSVSEVFCAAKALRTSKVKFLLDYDKVFGDEFLRCREDIRPFLPSEPWADGIVLDNDTKKDALETDEPKPKDPMTDVSMTDVPQTNEPKTDVPTTDDPKSKDPMTDVSMTDDPTTDVPMTDAPRIDAAVNNAHGHPSPDPSPPDAMIDFSLNEQTTVRDNPTNDSDAEDSDVSPYILHKASIPSRDDLIQWVVSHYAHCIEADPFTDHDEIPFLPWCEYWATRLRHAKNHDTQLLIRSQLMQSIARLENCHRSGKPESGQSMSAMMLLDLGEGEWVEMAEGKNHLSLPQTPMWMRWIGLHKQLAQHVASLGPAAISLQENISAQQTMHIDKISTYSYYKGLAEQMVLVDCFRLESIVMRFHETDPASTQELRDYYAGLWDVTVVKTLLMTNWQVLASFWATPDMAVLTQEQIRIYETIRSSHIPEPLSEVFHAPPVKPRRYRNPLVTEQEGMLSTLFGQLITPLETKPDSQAVTATQPRPSITPRTTPTPSPSLTVQKTTDEAISEPSTPHQVQTPSSSVTADPQTQNSASEAETKKRPSSPDGRHVKMPKLGSALTTEKVKELEDAQRREIEAVKEKMQGLENEVHDMRTWAEQELKVQQESSRPWMTWRIKTLEEQQQLIIQTLQTHVDQMDPLLQEVNLLSAFRNEAQPVMSSLRPIPNFVKTTQESLASTNKMLKMLGELFKEYNNPMPYLQASPGEPGSPDYLSRYCPAPNAMDQTTYESILLRAAFFYFHMFGDPDDGVSFEEAYLEDTMARYFTIAPDHVMKAIHHFHIQVYHRPMEE